MPLSKSNRFRTLLRASRLYMETPSRAAEAYRVLDQLDLTVAEHQRWERAVRRAVRERFKARMKRQYNVG